MDNILTILNGFIFALFLLVGWVVKFYIPGYMREKAKNLATKEDIGEITSIVENVKTTNAIEIEKIKSEIANDDKLLEKKRQVYENIAESLKVFISGHNSNEKVKENFHTAYSMAWLWAPDAVLKSLNDFLDRAMNIAEIQTPNGQEALKESFKQVLTEMRKDVGFESTIETKYCFVTFNK
jgi:hypothetical protein